MPRQRAFTLIELVIVLTILAILAAVAIPVFQDIQTAARNTATKGALAGVREAITQYRMNEIVSGRSSGSGTGVAAGWPTFGQVTNRGCPGFNAALAHVMADADLPKNPWALVSAFVSPGRADCALQCSCIQGATDGINDYGWYYDVDYGGFWATSNENDGNGTQPGNNCPGTTENCY